MASINRFSFANRLISVMLIASIMFSIVACSTNDKDETEETVVTIALAPSQDSDSPYAGDDLVEISIDELTVDNINVVSIDPQSIQCDPIIVDEIQSIEVQVVPLNDQIVTLAYENFVSIYGDDVDVRQLLTNVAVGAVVICVWVTLSAVGGPVGTFFGFVITSQITAAALVVGAAIDAAVSGYQAYQEGGDLTYILGHMLNGVAEGFMWSAILAPIFAGVEWGIGAIRTIKALSKLSAFKNLDKEEAKALFKKLDDLIRVTADLADNETDDALRAFYRNLPGEITEDIAEDTFVAFMRNRSAVISIARRLNPFGMRNKVVQALRDNLWDKLDDVSRDVVDQIIRDIQNRTITTLDELPDAFRVFITDNALEFLDCYADNLSNDFLENWLKEFIDDDVLTVIRQNISSRSGILTIARHIGASSLRELSDDPRFMALISCRFGSENAMRMRNISRLYRVLKGSSSVSDDAVFDLIEEIMNNGISKLDDIANVSMRTNIERSCESFASILRDLGVSSRNAGIVDELAITSLVNANVTEEIATDIVTNRLSKTAIINQYGEEVYQTLVDNSLSSLQAFSISSDYSADLVQSIVEDYLSAHNLSDDIIQRIVNGEPLAFWELSDDEIMEVANAVSEYYRTVDSVTYSNFVVEYAEVRGRMIQDAIEEYSQNNTITNIRYAGGTMVPSGANADYILQRYGEIQMSTYGFPIFDDYAIARVELNDLTGIEDIDIAAANLAHHGTQNSVPGYTWHHLEDGRTMILIPTDLHDAYRHTGGAALLREGLI